MRKIGIIIYFITRGEKVGSAYKFLDTCPNFPIAKHVEDAILELLKSHSDVIITNIQIIK